MSKDESGKAGSLFQNTKRKTFNVLVCPACHGEFDQQDRYMRCRQCGDKFHFNSQGQPDLRLNRPFERNITFELGTPLYLGDRLQLNRLMKNPFPEVDFSGLDTPRHLDEEILSYFPRAISKPSLALDLGCGNAIHKGVCEHAGFEYIGLDYRSPAATLLGDAHALPFRDDTFNFVLSVAVLEHIRFPFVMCKEIYRVMNPGAVLIGTVSFLEPFHDDSYYHHTHLGIFNLLSFAGFNITTIAPSVSHNILSASAKMRLFPGIPKGIRKALVVPLHFIHRILYRREYNKTQNDQWREKNRILSTTGVFVFIAQKK